MICPSCKKNNILSWKVWWANYFFRIICPNCQAELKMTKKGFGKISSQLIGLSIGVLIGLGIIKVFWSWPIFILVTFVGLVIDIQLDKHYQRKIYQLQL